MTPKEYIEELNRQKEIAQSRFDNLGSIELDVLDGSFSWLLDHLDLRAGLFEVPGNLPELMNTFVNEVVNIVEKNKAYQKSFSNYLSDLNVIYKNIAEFQQSYNKIAITKPGVTKVQRSVVNEIINQYTKNGLNENFASPLRDLIYSNVLAGMRQKDAKEYLKKYIVSGKDKSGKLKSYVEVTAMQGVSLYAGAINMQIGKEFEFTGLTISGSLIDTSSLQCRKAVEISEGGYLDYEEWKVILEIARKNEKAKLIEGTTISNLPLQKLHHGCRHDFTPTIKK